VDDAKGSEQTGGADGIDPGGPGDEVDDRDLARRLHEAAFVRGTFRLRSGVMAREYFDKYRFEADPVLLERVVRRLVPLVPDRVEVLAGLELGGIPLVTALSLSVGRPAAFVRKIAKEYGTRRLSEGADVGGRRVLVVEDVVTSGGQVAQSANELRRLGAEVQEALCVIDREGGAERLLAASGIRLVSLFRMSELEDAARRDGS